MFIATKLWPKDLLSQFTPFKYIYKILPNWEFNSFGYIVELDYNVSIPTFLKMSYYNEEIIVSDVTILVFWNDWYA